MTTFISLRPFYIASLKYWIKHDENQRVRKILLDYLNTYLVVEVHCPSEKSIQQRCIISVNVHTCILMFFINLFLIWTRVRTRKAEKREEVCLCCSLLYRLRLPVNRLWLCYYWWPWRLWTILHRRNSSPQPTLQITAISVEN